jgi:hypothetical protein
LGTPCSIVDIVVLLFVYSLSFQCDFQSSSDSGLKDGDTGKIWLCTEPGCNRAFKKPSKLKIHQMRHTGERPFKVPITHSITVLS